MITDTRVHGGVPTDDRLKRNTVDVMMDTKDDPPLPPPMPSSSPPPVVSTCAATIATAAVHMSPGDKTASVVDVDGTTLFMVRTIQC